MNLPITPLLSMEKDEKQQMLLETVKLLGGATWAHRPKLFWQKYL
jgi:hypothetical protein